MDKEARFKKWATEHPKEFKKLMEVPFRVAEAEKRRKELDKKIDANRDKIIKFRKEGESLENIAKKVSLPMKIVVGICRGINWQEAKSYRGAIKYMHLAEDRLAEMTLEKIGKRHKMSRQAVDGILKRYFSHISFPKVGKKSYLPTLTKKCLQCKKKMTGRGTYFKVRKFCSRDCTTLNKYGVIYHVASMSKEEYRKFNNKRCNDWYHKHKNDPAFKLKVKERNKRQIKRRKLKAKLSK